MHLGQTGRHLPVPVGQRHHDVQGGQKEHEVEEGVAVGDPVLLVVHGAIQVISFLEVVWVTGAILDQSRLVAGQGQLVNLGVGGVSDAAKTTMKHGTFISCPHSRS